MTTVIQPPMVQSTTVNHAETAARRIVQLEDGEGVSGISIPTLHPPGVAEMLLKTAIPEAIRDGVWVGESALLTWSGQEIPTSQVIIAHRGESGSIENLSTIVRDMGQRKAVEDALRESEERYRLLVETMNEGLIVLDEAGMISFANAWVMQLSGYQTEELIGRPASDFIDPKSREEWSKKCVERVRGDASRYEVIMLGRSGEEFHIRVSPRPVFAHDGVFRGVVAVLTDVTEQVRAAATLRASESELRELSAQLLTIQEMERKRIAADLHDGLGQSLSVLKFCVEDALRLLGAQSVEDSMNMLQLLLAKIKESMGEVRRITMDLRPSTLDDIGILATISWFSREYQKIYHGVAVEEEMGLSEMDVPGPLKTTLYRILQEAMNNIAKHAGADRVRIALRKVGEVVELSIEDNGVGFDQALVAAGKGAERGCGLVIMRERAALTGGTWTIKSTPGRGTVVRIAWSVV